MTTRRLGDYIVLGKIGSGSFASVWRGYQKDTKLQVAIKAISRAKLAPGMLERVEREISIMKTLVHPHIVKLYDTIRGERHIYLIMEYCEGGDLSQYIKKTGKLGERTALYFFQQLVSGLRYLYTSNLVHRDIKPQNLLLTTENGLIKLKLADFGFACHLQDQTLATTLCGSPTFMAPEILFHQPYDARVDLWSTGMVLYEMLYGRPPFAATNIMHLIQILKRQPVVIKEGSPCAPILRGLLRRNPTERTPFPVFFSQTLPQYSQIKQVMRQCELCERVAGQFFQKDPIASLSLHLKAAQLLQRFAITLDDEWYDIISYLQKEMRRQLVKAASLKPLCSQGTTICLEWKLYRLILALSRRACYYERRREFTQARSDYSLSQSLISFLAGDPRATSGDRSLLNDLGIRLQARITLTR